MQLDNYKYIDVGLITINGTAVQFSAKLEVKPEYCSVKARKAVGKNIEVQEVKSQWICI